MKDRRTYAARVTGAALAVLAGTAMVGAARVGVAAAAPVASCHAIGSGKFERPDPHCTPGALNPAVTQATIHRTICVSGWTATVRPPTSYTNRLKAAQMVAYGERGSLRSVEEDHFVPLELGGSPKSTLNLWPEPGSIPNPKDEVADAAHRAVCDGRMALATAQHGMISNWVLFGRSLHVKAVG